MNKFQHFEEEKLTDEHKAEMLRVAQDLHNIIKTHCQPLKHHPETGTSILNSKMQKRDALTSAAHILEFLAEFN